MTNNAHAGLIKLRKKLQHELEAILYQEEVWWFQKSREDWINSGDRNTRYYHTATNTKRSRSNIIHLKDDQGNWIQDNEGMRKMWYEYFSAIFSHDRQAGTPTEYIVDFPRLDTTDWEYVAADFSPEDVKKAVQDMAPLKAPGPDGLHTLFYQREWSIVGESRVRLVNDFMHTGNLPEGINDTLVALIPKVPNPERVSEFRPISLCNVNYKIITKAMTTRIKEVMRSLVGQEQSSFVRERQITDNIIIYQEVMHGFHKKKGKKGMMAIKIDLEKAYDRLSWNFLKDTLQKAGFNDAWVRGTMTCVSTSRLSILWNGEGSDWILLTGGIRQGDAISPYLFVLCIERLCHSIKEARDSGWWRGISLDSYGPILTHLLFSNDMVLFAEAAEDQVLVIKQCLDDFCRASGQRDSYEKSQIFFSANTEEGTMHRIIEQLSINQTRDMGRYLGVQSIHGRTTSSIFTPPLEKMDARLEGWRSKNLSLAGRHVLAQAVLATIPYYTMQTTTMPKAVCEAIDKKIRNFLWGNKDGASRIHLINWDITTRSKKYGGIGLRKTKEMNNAFLTKLSWRMKTEGNNLWVNVLKHKYMRNREGRQETRGKRGESNLWRGLCDTNHILDEGVRYKIHNGQGASFWKDIWLGEEALLTWVPNNLSEDMTEGRVSDYWIQGEGWRWSAIGEKIPAEIRHKLKATTINQEDDEGDVIFWAHSESGNFSISSAYNRINGNASVFQDHGWKNLWKVKAPSRMIMFLWLVRHGRIMMNDERRRRNMTPDGYCPLCANVPETVEHVIRECRRARKVWRELVGDRVMQQTSGM